MKVTKTAINGVLILEPKVFGDERGFFMESYNQKIFTDAIGYKVDFVQNDESNPRKLMLDRIDLWVNSTRSSQPLLAKLGLLGKVAPVLSFNQAKLYLACNRAVPEPVAARMHAALRSMEADGTYKAIEQRYEYLHEQASKPQSERSSTNSSFQHLENLK